MDPDPINVSECWFFSADADSANQRQPGLVILCLPAYLPTYLQTGGKLHQRRASCDVIGREEEEEALLVGLHIHPLQPSEGLLRMQLQLHCRAAESHCSFTRVASAIVKGVKVPAAG